MKKLFYFILLLTAVFCIVINLAANKLIFYPVTNYAAHLLPVQELTFAAADGVTRLHAVYLPPAEFMDTILFYHGNAGNVTYFEDFAEIYHKRGYGVFIYDYRGFGRSPGKMSQSATYADAAAAANYLIGEKKTAPNNIILWGYSFGCAPAIKTAATMADVPFKALILQSPFTNTPQMAAALAGGGYNPQSMPQKIITGIMQIALFDKTYDNLANIGGVKIPILIGCGAQDSLIPWQMSAALAAAAPRGAQTYLSPHGKHPAYAWFEGAVVDFLNILK